MYFDLTGHEMISIHAPREGGDSPGTVYKPFFIIISIHAPREGGDGIYDLLKNALAISIHAPREGGDCFCLCGQY